MDRSDIPEHLAERQERAHRLGAAGVRQSASAWRRLIDEVRTETVQGSDPKRDRVWAREARWREWGAACTGGTPEVGRSLQRMWQQETTIHGFDTNEMRRLRAYVVPANEDAGTAG